MATSRLVRNSLWTLAGQVARVAASGATFILVARALGPEQMGAFIAVSSIMWVVAPFSGIGFGMLLLQRVSRDQAAFNSAFGDAIAVTLTSGGALLILATLVGQSILPDTISLDIFLMVGAAELIAARLLDICSQSFQAHSRMRESAGMLALLSIARVTAAAILLGAGFEPTAHNWSGLLLVSSVLAALIAMTETIRRLGVPSMPHWSAVRGARTGVFFSLGLAAQSIYNDIDKAMLSSLVSLSAAGIYGAAYKLVEFVFTPVRSVLMAAAATIFARGGKGTSSAFVYSRRLIPYGLTYALFAGAGIFLLAPMTPMLLGVEYTQSINLIRALALLPVLKVVHSIVADTLGASGHQAVRSAVQIAIALVNVALNLALLPALGMWGAVITSLVCDALLGVSMWIALAYAVRRDSRFVKQGI